jgi:uncharacterized protein
MAAAAVAIPPLQSRVTDLAGTLSGDQKAGLERTLAEFEKRKGAQIAVLIVPTTRPETVEQYAVRVQEAWKLGRKGVDDGLLLLIAKEDRKLRFEVGYGLEGVLPDAAAKRIIEQDITPRFKQGDFYGGIRAGLDRAMRTVEGEPLPAPRASTAAPQNLDLSWFIYAFFFSIIGGGVLKAIFGRFLGGGIAGGTVGVVLWLLAGSVLIGVLAGVIGFILSLGAGVPARAQRGGTSDGGWGSGGGGWSSGGSSDGGFSGGGGSSGGGGASGSW